MLNCNNYYDVIGYPGLPTNFTCESNGSNIILLWSLMPDDKLVQGYNVQAIPGSMKFNDCSVLNYSNVTSNTFTISTSLSDNICDYAVYTVRAVNCLGEGQPAICVIEKG